MECGMMFTTWIFFVTVVAMLLWRPCTLIARSAQQLLSSTDRQSDLWQLANPLWGRQDQRDVQRHMSFWWCRCGQVLELWRVQHIN